MQIRTKVCLPLVSITLCIGAVCYWLILSQLEKLNETNLINLIEAKASQVGQAIDLSGSQAMQMAALVSRLPEVEAAYRKAMQGDINDEKSPASQEGREMLRKSLAPLIEGFSANVGEKPKIHYHLPPARSFARLWRDKQTRRGGEWVDISDDISAFRPTVLEVNRSGKALQGVEVGSGGFEIRGLAPVVGAGGDRLGSVEALISFDPVLDGVRRGEGQEALLYMNADRLNVATRLQDKAKFPVVDDAYVLVSGTKDGETEKLVTREFLDSGREGMRWEERGSTLLAAIPVKDYRGAQTGMLVFAFDMGKQIAIMKSAGMVLVAAFAALLVAPVIVAFLVLGIAVVGPVRNMMSRIKDIAEDKADLANRLNDSARDEIGELASWFNRLMGKLEAILCDVEGYRNLVDAVPDPIFGVDEEFHILIANKATQTLLGKNIDFIRGRCCHDELKTSACQTENCPIEQAKRHGASTPDTIIDIGSPEKPRYIQPVSDELKDCHGKRIGYVEVARDVTSLVMKEREIEANMARLSEINAAIGEAADLLTESASRMVDRFQVVSDGAEEQNQRAQATAAAMEEMNATVREVAQSALDAAGKTADAKDKAKEGAQVVAQAVSAIAEVSQRASSLHENMGRLGQQTESIGRIMGVISDIADQTNLLALNAAIEAARAGEAGRGFAVVADEVRKLAEKTMAATKEVTEAITAIQTETRTNMSDMEGAADAVEKATGLAEKSGDALEEIVDLVVNASDRAQTIAAAAEEQSATSDEITDAVSEVNRIAENTNELTTELKNAVMEISRLAEKLKELSRG